MQARQARWKIKLHRNIEGSVGRQTLCISSPLWATFPGIHAQLYNQFNLTTKQTRDNDATESQTHAALIEVPWWLRDLQSTKST